MLLRGTPLYYQKNELGLIQGTDIANPILDRIQKFILHVVTTPSMAYGDWKKMADIAVALQEHHAAKTPTSVKSRKCIVTSGKLTGSRPR